jgi:hypothetical protein
MKLKLDARNPRIVTDEDGNELFTFRGLHLEDLREIVARVNHAERPFILEDGQEISRGYYKNKVAI